MNWRAHLVVVIGLASSSALAQSSNPPSSDCHRDSVVITRCVDDVPGTAGSSAPQDTQAQKDARQKKETQDALDRQRAEASAKAAAANSDELEDANVVGHRERQKSADEIFDGYFGTKGGGTTTKSSDSMGNNTECIDRCAGPACCKTVLANPASPGAINHEP